MSNESPSGQRTPPLLVILDVLHTARLHHATYKWTKIYLTYMNNRLGCFMGAMTLGIMTLSLTTLGITTLGIKTFSKMINIARHSA
jgi:hypothetical protein